MRLFGKLKRCSFYDLLFTAAGLCWTHARLVCLPGSWNRNWIFGSRGGTSGCDTLSGPPQEDELACIRSCAGLVGRVASRLGPSMSCLRRSLVLRDLLARKGILCEVRVGAGKVPGTGDGTETRQPGDPGKEYLFHAWLSYRGIPIDTCGSPQNFVPFSAGTPGEKE